VRLEIALKPIAGKVINSKLRFGEVKWKQSLSAPE